MWVCLPQTAQFIVLGILSYLTQYLCVYSQKTTGSRQKQVPKQLQCKTLFRANTNECVSIHNFIRISMRVAPVPVVNDDVVVALVLVHFLFI